MKVPDNITIVEIKRLVSSVTDGVWVYRWVSEIVYEVKRKDPQP